MIAVSTNDVLKMRKYFYMYDTNLDTKIFLSC